MLAIDKTFMNGSDELSLSLRYYSIAKASTRTTPSVRLSPGSADIAGRNGKKTSVSGHTTNGRAPLDVVKLLLVHGFCQNAKLFASRTSNLRSKALKAPGKLKLDCVFAESPLLVHDVLRPEDPELDPRAWFNPQEAMDGDASIRPVNSNAYCDWAGPLDALRSFCQEQGPLHGVLAFSQGGVPAAAMLFEQKSQMRCGIFVSCFAPLDPEVGGLFEAARAEPVDVPTMHVIGTSDPFVAEERSLQLSRMFKDPVVVYHDGGHIMIPKDLFGDVKEFLARAFS